MADANSASCTIYAIVDPLTGSYRYVGQTRTALWRRLADHIAGAGRSQVRPVLAWIHSVYESGLEVKIVPLEINAHPDREKEWIAKLFAENAPLLNVEHCGRRRSEISFAKMADPKVRSNHRKAMQAAMQRPEVREAISSGSLGKSKTEDHRLALGDAARKRAKDPEMRAAMQVVARNLSDNEKRKQRSVEAHQTSEFRALMAERTRNNLAQDPSIRARMSEGCRQSWARRKAAETCRS